MARHKRSKGDKPEELQTAIPFQEAQTPEELRVFPHELRAGDRVTVGGTEWEVAATPSGYLKGRWSPSGSGSPGSRP
jgi:hypothetical protein